MTDSFNVSCIQATVTCVDQSQQRLWFPLRSERNEILIADPDRQDFFSTSHVENLVIKCNKFLVKFIINIFIGKLWFVNNYFSALNFSCSSGEIISFLILVSFSTQPFMNRGRVLVEIKYAATVQPRHKMLCSKAMLCALISLFICKAPVCQLSYLSLTRI